MDVETAIQAFVSAGNDLPREAMQWTLDHWDTVAPELLGTLERYTSGADRSDEAARAVLFILHLAGEKQDTRVFPLLCRLAQDGEAIKAALGDGTTITLKQILISTDDGNLDTLKGLIEAAEADQFVRAGALEVLAYLTATGRIPRDETEAYLLRLYDTLQPQQESFVWSGWVLAIALLGLEAFSGVVRQAFGRGLIEPMVMNYDNFRRDLARTLADPECMAGFSVSGARESGSERLLIAAVVGRVPCSRSGRGCRRAPQWRQHFLNFLPLPHGQGSVRPTPFNGSTDDWGASAKVRRASPGRVARRS